MKRLMMVLVAGAALFCSANVAKADWGWGCGNSAPKGSFWNRTNCQNCCSADEARWQKFWHDYYRALGSYYKKLDRLDWVIYYKFHGYQTGGCGPVMPQNCQAQRPNYAPVFVNPTMHWGNPVCGQAGCTPAGGVMPR